MNELRDLIPQTPLEGPPLPSGIKVKWTDDPGKVARAIENYARAIQHPTVYPLMSRGITKYRWEKGFSPGDPIKDVQAWIASQQQAVRNYARFLEGKLP